MGTVKTVARQVLAAVDSDVSYLLVVRWIDSRYKELVSKVRFRHLRKIGELAVPAVYTTGTVAATRGSTTLTGTSTEWETTIGSGSQEDWYIKLTSAWYKIASVDSETQLTLATAFSEDTVTAATHETAKKFIAVDSSARWLGSFVFTRLRVNLGDPISMNRLDALAPGRLLTASYPLWVAQGPNNSSNVIRVELYPYCNESEIIHYIYWDLPSTLSEDTTVPPQIDDHILREGALIDLYRYLKSRAYHNGLTDIGNSWRNDEHAQRTIWNRLIQDAKRTDRGADDTTFVLQTFGGGVSQGGDIRDAHDMVYSRWTYPG